MNACKKLQRTTYEKIQLDTRQRLRWARCVDAMTRHKFQQWTGCDKSYQETFTPFSRFDSSEGYINQGTYGKVFKMRLKDPEAPPFPLAIKRSFGQEIDEARYMVRVTALVESNVNPHFTVLFNHFHCEKDIYYPQTEHISYIESLKQIKALEDRKRELQNKWLSYKHRVEIQSTIPKKIRQIIKNRVPTISEIQWVANMKSTALKQYNNDDITDEAERKRILDTLEKSTILLRDMLKKRNAMADTKPYEIFVMEYNDGSLWNWLKTHRSARELFSMAFQVCMALLSLLGYWDMVQNDLNLNNIMYTRVYSQGRRKWYTYKMGSHVFQAQYEGYMFKVIDFGLAASIHEPRKLYCVGAVKNKQCNRWNRDFVEFFYHMQYIPRTRSTFHQWVKDAYNKLTQNPPTSLTGLVDVLAGIFQNIPRQVVRTLTTTTTGMQVYNVTGNARLRQKVRNKATQRKWFENVSV